MVLHFLLDDESLTADAGELVEFGGAEAHHAAVVRRVRVGEAVTLGDGKGTWLRGTVVSAAPKLVSVRVDERREIAPPDRELVLVQALAKGDRDELAVQAATELGADGMLPWQAARSVSRWDAAKAAKGVARWQSIVREASKQAHRAWVPPVGEPVSTATLAREDALVLVLDPTATEPLSGVNLGDARRILLVVGPEGGIAPEELATLADAGAVRVRLGETVLRTSTAGPAALAVLSARVGRW